MARVLITGASGLLGSNLAADWAGQHELIGMYHRNFVAIEGVEMVQADLSRPETVRELIGAYQPDWVVNCAAATNLDRCEEDPRWAEALNHRLAAEVAEAAIEANAALIHISTDAVFDGRGGAYREEDPPNPISVYGRTKLAGERAVMSAYPQALVVRTNLFGWNKQQKQNLAERFLSNLESGMRCPGFEDVLFSPILVNDLSDLLQRLFHKGASGVLHLGGRTCLSKYEFGVRLARAVGANPELVRPVSVEDAGLGAPRAKKLCMDSSKAEQMLGLSIPDIDGGINRLFELRARRQVQESEAEG